jgi:hypothetical protein
VGVEGGGRLRLPVGRVDGQVGEVGGAKMVVVVFRRFFFPSPFVRFPSLPDDEAARRSGRRLRATVCDADGRLTETVKILIKDFLLERKITSSAALFNSEYASGKYLDGF